MTFAGIGCVSSIIDRGGAFCMDAYSMFIPRYLYAAGFQEIKAVLRKLFYIDCEINNKRV